MFLSVAACTPARAPDTPDLAAPSGGVPAGAFEDCTPASDDPPCAAGLRCGLVLVGDPPYQGALTQCVPVAPAPLSEDAPCALDQVAPAQEGAARKRFDRCAEGHGCVETPTAGLRCRRLCTLRVPGQCGAGRLCVLPTQVLSAGYCHAPDGCQAVPQQSGCPRGPDGQVLGCYALTESKVDRKPPPGGGTFCLQHVPLGGESGQLDSRCDRSVNCRPGLACVGLNGAPVCRPYCAHPPLDGGLPDGGTVPCPADLGTCHPITHLERIGRCY